MKLTQSIAVLLVVLAPTFCSGSYNWVSSLSNIPHNAVVGGYDADKRPLFVGRAYHNGFYIAGKVSAYRQRAYVPYGGKELIKTDWQYLVGENFTWIRTYDGLTPRNAVRNDLAENNNIEYIGRQFYKDSLNPGKVSTARGRLYMTYGGKEVYVDKYEVLVTPQCDCALSQW